MKRIRKTYIEVVNKNNGDLIIRNVKYKGKSQPNYEIISEIRIAYSGTKRFQEIINEAVNAIDKRISDGRLQLTIYEY